MEKIQEYFRSHDIHDVHPSDIAKILKELDTEGLHKALSFIPRNVLGDVILGLPDRYFGTIIDALSIDDITAAVVALESDDQADFMEELQEFDKEIAVNVFDKLDSHDQYDIVRLQNYNDHEAGAYMQTEVFTATKNEVVEEIVARFSRLRKQNELENVQNLFITDTENKLLYAVGLDDLLTFDFKQTLAANMQETGKNYEPKVAKDRENIREIVHYFEAYDLSVMPITNAYGILLGRITSDDIYDIINEQATEQMYHLAGVDDEAEEDEKIFTATRNRASWLGLNIITALISSVVIAMFAETIENIVALAILMPIVASMGGNVGIQSLTVVVRQLALGGIGIEDAKRIIRREVSIALLNGLLFALIVGCIAFLWFDMKLLGLVIGLSMVINLVIAGLIGSMTPLVLKKLGIDPAVGSSVILTFITDVIGFLSFLGLATWILL